MVEVDHGRAADRLGDAPRRLVQVLQRGHLFDPDTGQTLRVTAAPCLTLQINSLLEDLLGDVLNQHGDTLSYAGEPAAHGGDDAIHIHDRAAAAELHLLVHPGLAGFSHLLENTLELGNHLFHPQSDHANVRSELLQLACKLHPSVIGQLEAQFVGGEDRYPDGCGLQHRLEANARVDLLPGQLIRGAVPFLRDASEAMNVTGRADALGYRLRELQIFRVEVAVRVGLRDHQRSDPLAV